MARARELRGGVLANCGSSNGGATPAQTAILAWDHTRATRAAVRIATPGAHAKYDHAWLVHPTADSTIALAIHFETAQLALLDAGKTIEHDVPVIANVTVTDSGDYAIGNGFRCDGPDYELGEADPAHAWC